MKFVLQKSFLGTGIMGEVDWSTIILFYTKMDFYFTNLDFYTQDLIPHKNSVFSLNCPRVLTKTSSEIYSKFGKV